MTRMTPTEFATWVGAIGGGFVTLAIAAAKVMEAFGMRPQDRREHAAKEIKDLKERCEGLERQLSEVRKELNDTHDDLRQERRNVDLMERLLTRQGWRKGPDGWEIDKRRGRQ